MSDSKHESKEKYKKDKNKKGNPKFNKKTAEAKAYKNVIGEFNVHKVNVKELTSALSNLVDVCAYWNDWKSKGAGNEDEEKRATVKGLVKMLKNIKSGETKMRKWMSKPPPVIDRKRVERLRVISWDLGNQNIEYLYERMNAVADFVEREEFDIVLLQKVNPLSARYLKVRLYEKYKFIPGRILKADELMDVKYILTRYETLDFVSSKIIKFQEPDEKNDILKTEVKIGSETVYILNTLLRSGHENSEQRIKQMQECFQFFQYFSNDTSAILGGNFNIREWELEKLDISLDLLNDWDIWVNFGQRGKTFTWDLRVNKLIQISGCETRSQPFKRFDRMYFRKNVVPVISPVFFDICGKEIMAGGKYCVSDHFGIITDFQVNPDCYSDQSVLGAFLGDLNLELEAKTEEQEEAWTALFTTTKPRDSKEHGIGEISSIDLSNSEPGQEEQTDATGVENDEEYRSKIAVRVRNRNKIGDIHIQ